MNPLSYYQAIVNEQSKQVKEQYRPRYHFTAPCGFINDPNGFTVYNGKFQLFYQCRYEGVVGWGHAESADLMHFTHLPLAVFPGEAYDKDGCWSGGAMEKDGKLYILYTGQTNATQTAPQHEVQCLAVSEDGGITFRKIESNHVIVPEQMTGDFSTSDFRDPSVWKHGDSYYTVVGNSKNSAWKGQAQLFTSKDLLSWQYVGVMYEDASLGDMWECPSFMPVDENTDLLVMSPIAVPVSGHAYHNSRSTVYLIGKLNYQTGKFTPRKIGEVDYGKDFYAAQITKSPQGEPTLIAWMANWGREYYTERNAGFANNFTLPRRLQLTGDEFLQFPARGVEESFHLSQTSQAILQNETKSFDGIGGNCCRLKVNADMTDAQTFAVKVFVGGGYESVISYEKNSGVLTLDTSHSQYPTNGEDRERVKEGVRTAPLALSKNLLTLDIFIDVNAIEVFAGAGKIAMSSMSFNDLSYTDIAFSAQGKATVTVEKYDYE